MGREILSQTKYKLVEKDSYASCTTYEVRDTNNKTVLLPAKFNEVLDCPAMININDNILTFELNGVRQYNLDTGKEHLLFHNYDDIDGCSGPAWSEDNTKVMFVVINQQMKHNYTAMCRIIVLTLNEDGSVAGKQKFDRNVNFSCGSICSSFPGEDFYFIDNNTIAYREHTIDKTDFVIRKLLIE